MPKGTEIDTPEPGSLDYQILVQFLFNDPGGSGMRSGELAEKLNIRQSTVNSALKRLEIMGYLTWKHYGDAELTNKGKDALKHLEVHHHLIEVFLADSLQMTPEEAHAESMKVASHFSCLAIKRICDKYGNPEFCPSNMKIPDFPACHVHEE
jgi:Mn-dependent DtxR family transcriptional regulator